MWWIALAAVSAASGPVSDEAPAVSRQAQATVRIVNPTRVRLGQDATDRDDLKIAATDSRFRDADGSFHPAKLVEFP